MGSLPVQCQVFVGWAAILVEGVPPVSVYFMLGSIRRGVFFLTAEEQNETVPVVSRSVRVALSSPGLNQVSRCPFE